ncbi:MAG TPA: amidase [Hyphomicrobiaceae bacterium]|nr:amidase [Hyphomicrobiaceae bacterium]
MADLDYATASEIAAKIASGKVSTTEVIRSTLDRAERAQRAYNCFITIAADQALAAAAKADEAVRRGAALGPLAGVPFHVKDLVNTRGVRTTFASAIYEHNVPAANAVSVDRLEAAGAIMIGKTMTPEFGHMPYTEAPLFGRTRNAYSAERTSGGSSGGAAVAIAAGVAPLAIATDAGGSTRIPAACNGVVGFKQSLGLVPHDMAPDAFANLSYITPTTRTVMDTALMLEVMGGAHPADPHSFAASTKGLVAAARGEGDLKGTRMAWRPFLGNTVIDREVLAMTEATTKVFATLGASLEAMDDDMSATEPMWLVLSTGLWNARFGDQLAKWRDRMSPTLVRQMEGGGRHTSEDLARANLERTRIYRKVQGWFDRFDIIAMPTLTRTALPIEERLFEPIEIEGKPVDTIRKAWYPYTHPFNLTGNPAVTLPAGFAKDGLPVAIQLVGRRGEDARLLHAAALLEKAQPWSARRPEFH